MGTGDEIVNVGQTEDRMTVPEVNALLYSPYHACDRLERPLQITALSPGLRASFSSLLQSSTRGIAGLVRRQPRIRPYRDFGGLR